MRKNFGAKPILYPQPVFILATYNEDGTADAMNAAWGGISDSNEISMCIGASHRTTRNALARGAFTVSMGTADTVAACDYVGLVSGEKEPNKRGHRRTIRRRVGRCLFRHLRHENSSIYLQ